MDRKARVQSQVERSEPKGNLDGFLARLHSQQRNEGKSQLLQADCGEVGDWVSPKAATPMADTPHFAVALENALGSQVLRAIGDSHSLTSQSPEKHRRSKQKVSYLHGYLSRNAHAMTFAAELLLNFG